ncbi:MAG TPA: 50S ribosomal protein L24 [Atribacteraceae bacterium]|nr:50S ribosomal protein L24 [Atribacteraceae bacterium]
MARVNKPKVRIPPIKKGDKVIVIHGKNRGKNGKVLTVDRKGERAVVERINMVKKHTRATQQNPQGGIIEKENPIRLSNLRLICPRCNDLTRVKRTVISGSDFRVRTCHKCREIIDKV